MIGEDPRRARSPISLLPVLLRKTQAYAMNQLDQQLDRLLRSAATAEVTSHPHAAIPEVRDLLRQHELGATAAAGLYRTLRGGLAIACGLLTLALLVNGLRLHQTRHDLLTVPKALLARHATP